MLEHSEINTKRSCQLAGLSRSSWYRQPVESAQNQAMRKRLRQLANERPIFGSPRMTTLLQREFGVVNHKRVERLYAEEGLQLPRRPKRRRRGVSRPVPRIEATAPGQRGSMDFVHDILADGRRIRVFTLVDDFSRECLALDKGVKLNFIEPGKPTQNAFIESFNGKFRHECLRQHRFESLYEARNIVEDWRQDYNHRPHSSLNYKTPKEVVRQHEMIKNQPLDSHSACVT